MKNYINFINESNNTKYHKGDIVVITEGFGRLDNGDKAIVMGYNDNGQYLLMFPNRKDLHDGAGTWDDWSQRFVTGFEPGECWWVHPQYFKLYKYDKPEETNYEEWVQESNDSEFYIGRKIKVLIPPEGRPYLSGKIGVIERIGDFVLDVEFDDIDWREYTDKKKNWRDYLGLSSSPFGGNVMSFHYDFLKKDLNKTFMFLDDYEKTNYEEWVEEGNNDGDLGYKEKDVNTQYEKLKKEREQYKLDVTTAATRIQKNLNTRHPNSTKYMHPIVLKYKKPFSIVKKDVELELKKLGVLLNQ